jgi:hypothetical protein
MPSMASSFWRTGPPFAADRDPNANLREHILTGSKLRYSNRLACLAEANADKAQKKQIESHLGEPLWI